MVFVFFPDRYGLNGKEEQEEQEEEGAEEKKKRWGGLDRAGESDRERWRGVMVGRWKMEDGRWKMGGDEVVWKGKKAGLAHKLSKEAKLGGKGGTDQPAASNSRGSCRHVHV
ncbi:hypothetical protein TWF718_008889 [Orbilia javanica]|uniref:Uncharacterized protein n=1 Tax=Orbilia javanica TaxID=47235 RepID=A0AAN8MLG3_9PEZI